MIRGSGAPGGQVQGTDWEQQYTHDTIITHMILLIPNSFQMFVVDISLRHQNLQMCFFLSAKCVCVCVPPCYKKTHVFVLTLEKNQCGLEATEKKRHADKFHTHTHIQTP